MAFYLDRLESIQAALLGVFQISSPSQQTWSNDSLSTLKDRVQFLSQGTADLSGDLEICFKTILSSSLQEEELLRPIPKQGEEEEENIGIDKGIDIEASSSIRLISFAFEFALQFAAAPGTENVPKIPFQLIEDLLEHQTIHQAKCIWRVIESWVGKITNPLMFSKGKLVVLKTCNSLLRKLSKSCDTEFCGRILMFLAAVYPLSEPSALNLPGKINTANVTYYDSSDKFITAPTNDNSSIAYDLYESFWKLQSSFASNIKVFDTVSWNEFMALAKKTVEVFKTITVADDPSKSDGFQKKSAHSSNSYRGNKYLTSSQLFKLQLNDPLLRQQVGVQILFFTHFLQVKGLCVVTDIALKNNYASDLLYLHNQAKDLIENSGNATTDLVEVITRILSREEAWFNWKSKNCPDFVRKITPESLQTITGAKRKAGDMDEETTEVPKDSPHEIPSATLNRVLSRTVETVFDCSDENVKDVARNLADTSKSLDSMIEIYLDAEDPEMAIEEEYHPKNDHLYCWRTRRLLAQSNLEVFSIMSNGDLGKGIRKLRNLPEPLPRLPEPISHDDLVATPTAAAEISESKSEELVDSDGLYDFLETKSETTFPRANDQIPEEGEEPEDGEELENM